MDDLLAKLSVGTRLRIMNARYIVFSRIPFDRMDDLIVLRDRDLPLDHPASLRTMLGCTLADLHRLGCIDLGARGSQEGLSIFSPVAQERARELTPAS